MVKLRCSLCGGVFENGMFNLFDDKLICSFCFEDPNFKQVVDFDAKEPYVVDWEEVKRRVEKPKAADPTLVPVGSLKCVLESDLNELERLSKKIAPIPHKSLKAIGAFSTHSFPMQDHQDDAALVKKDDAVNHPNHYTRGGIEVADACEAWQLGAHEWNIVKYVARAKFKGKELQDLKKAQWYLNRKIQKLEKDGSR